MDFKSYLKEQEQLNEVLITLGNKRPKFGQVVLLAGGAGCHKIDTEVLMFDGSYKKVQDIAVNDILMGPDSKPRTVEVLHTGREKMLKVISNKGDEYICNINHNHTFYFGKTIKSRNIVKDQVKVMKYNEFINLPKTLQKRAYVYKTSELQFDVDNYNFNIDPWIVGFWLGDGTVGTPNFTIENNSPLLNHIKENYQNDMYSFNELKTSKTGCKPYSLTYKAHKENPFLGYLKTCFIDGDKRIPKELLLSSIENRLKVLAGLIDSDGYNNQGYYEIVTKFDGLKEDIDFLCGSLGFRTKTTIKKVKWNGENKYYHRIYISGNFENLNNYIVLDYKKSVQNKNKNPLKMSFKIEELPEDDFYGFSIKEDDKRFILKNFLVQNNSGKGYVTDKLLGIEGKVFDVDEIKSKIISPKTVKLNQRIKDIYGIDVTKFDLRDPRDVETLHYINDQMGISKKDQKQFLDAIRNTERLPNLIFDTTMKSLTKLKDITDTVKTAGYKAENVHLVWVINDIDKAIEQNMARERVVPHDILVQTHQMVSATMAALLKDSSLMNYIDGDVWLVFNKQFVDSTMAFAKNLDNNSLQNNVEDPLLKKLSGSKKDRTGSWVEDALLLKVKSKGKRPTSFKEIPSMFIDRIKQYVPKNTLASWGG